MTSKRAKVEVERRWRRPRSKASSGQEGSRTSKVSGEQTPLTSTKAENAMVAATVGQCHTRKFQVGSGSHVHQIQSIETKVNSSRSTYIRHGFGRIKLADRLQRTESPCQPNRTKLPAQPKLTRG